jgi:hypothetical protein
MGLNAAEAFFTTADILSFDRLRRVPHFRAIHELDEGPEPWSDLTFVGRLLRRDSSGLSTIGCCIFASCLLQLMSGALSCL